jgi:hypothetical protein
MMNPDDLQSTSAESAPEAGAIAENAGPKEPGENAGMASPETAGAMDADSDSAGAGAIAPQQSAQDGESLSSESSEPLSVEQLTAQKQTLQAELGELTRQRDSLAQAIANKQVALDSLFETNLASFKQRQEELQRSLDQLERRRDAVRKEMRENFAGASQDLALRVQGFKDYLVGSLQDLASAADKLELVRDNRTFQASPQDSPAPGAASGGKQALPLPEFARKTDLEQESQIRDLLTRYRNSPDYYGPAWQLRRTFEAVHEEAIAKWFFEQGGRGALRTLGSRLQNILVASSAISILNEFYGDRVCALILANSPERLGDWRRGLQECLGISRQDFGPNQGVVLCESPEVLAQRAQRMLQAGDLPLVILDESELLVDVSLLRFPLWLAFAPDPAKPRPSYDEPFGPERPTGQKAGGGLFEGSDNLFERALGGLGLGREDNSRYGNGYGSDDSGLNDYGRNDYGSNDYGRDDYGRAGSTGSGGYDQPAYGQPGYGQAGYDQPSYGQSAYDQGSYAPSGYDQSYRQPSGSQSAYGQSDVYGDRGSNASANANASANDWDNDPSYDAQGYGQPPAPGRSPASGQDAASQRYNSGSDYGARREPRRSRYSEGEAERYGSSDRPDDNDDWL